MMQGKNLYIVHGIICLLFISSLNTFSVIKDISPVNSPFYACMYINLSNYLQITYHSCPVEEILRVYLLLN